MTVNRKPTVGPPARFARGMTCDQYVAYIGPRRTSSARQGAAVRLAGTMSGGEQQMLAMGRPYVNGEQACRSSAPRGRRTSTGSVGRPLDLACHRH